MTINNVIVSVTDLRKMIGRREILKGLTFSIENGEVFGIVGPNGAGKTTTLRILAGVIKDYNGNVNILGLSPSRAKQLGYISYMPEDAFPYEKLTGYENLEFYAELYSKGNRELKEEFIKLGIQIAGLGNRIYDKTSEYSRGMKRRLIIARTLMVNPKIAILDEPTSALDVESAVRIRNIIVDMAKKHNMTIILSSHNMLEVEFLCDRILLMNDGRELALGKPKELVKDTESKNLEEVFLKLVFGDKR
ncbi:multidrug ABC transporter ATP-binding protein [Sulfolobus sp. A20]|uniref:ABC transporter ATP-binding protein n=1 Tax=Saccharolobus sp. A20 TaxID=1891280 RepID=UPI000845D07F|nr:ABC transporter ATP-binding protein [Sulfolobus sp. A20]TRM77658.1 ABC transporter ATP-binding protein [Sulfolobus sp. B5]TRM78426.1 ABC transporter ATP-binding protein [Sulfolobus sp. A20-N-F8]TRM82118.1 ABC transporter ATP-binding protein [Sulfolobus sp. D5]TRM89181.1 ABC transporter ATP-binding protein [Sulfolobus sp. C3]TRN03579.1 ABC transporter ATP-binding protein [Sulfolobus sp. F1]